jgi:hypothetical protein
MLPHFFLLLVSKGDKTFIDKGFGMWYDISTAQTGRERYKTKYTMIYRFSIMLFVRFND